MVEIKIVYIDDNLDEQISEYIKEKYCTIAYTGKNPAQTVQKSYDEVTFESSQGYKNLLYDIRARSANVILIDNKLFTEDGAAQGKFSGKQFKVISRKLLPFVVVLVISQDLVVTGDNIIKKFSGKNIGDSTSYYEENLGCMLDVAIEEVLEYMSLAEDLNKSADVEKVLIEKIAQSLKGEDSYDSLTKADIDLLISSFKELKNYGEH